MQTSTHRAWLRAATVSLALAAIGAPAALAGHQDGLGRDLPDGYQPQLQGRTSLVGDRGTPDGYQPQLQAPERIVVDGWAGRFDVREPASLIGYRGTPDGYQPQLTAREPRTVPVEVTGHFDWTDAGIGALAAFGLMLLASGAALAVRHGRRGSMA